MATTFLRTRDLAGVSNFSVHFRHLPTYSLVQPARRGYPESGCRTIPGSPALPPGLPPHASDARPAGSSRSEEALEPFEFDMLTTLRRAGDPYELTASALLRAALVTSGAITNRIDRMEVKGLVERVRDSDDRRSVRIRLTPQGREVLDAIFGLHVANMERILQPLDQHTREQLANALRTLLESFGDTSLS